MSGFCKYKKTFRYKILIYIFTIINERKYIFRCFIEKIFIMATQNDSYDRQLSSGGSGDNRKGRVILYVVIFIVGIVAGVIGLCSALKFIFYVGLFVTIVAAVGIVVGVIVAKNKIQDAADRDDR